MNNTLFELIENQYLETKGICERKQQILSAAVDEYRKWVSTATEYEIVNSDLRLKDIQKKREVLDIRKEELNRLQWLYEEAKKEIEK